MIGYEMQAKGLSEQVAKLDRFDAFASKEMRPAMLQSVRTIGGHAQDNAPVGLTGEVAGSFRHKVGQYAGSAGDVYGVVSNPVFYARFLEFGTDPHWPPSGPGSKIEQWASENGMDAFLAARKIARTGVKARRFLFRGFRESREEIDGFFARALERIANALKV